MGGTYVSMHPGTLPTGTLLVDMIGALFDFGSAGFRDLRDMLLLQITGVCATVQGDLCGRPLSAAGLRGSRLGHRHYRAQSEGGGAAHPPVPSGMEVMRGKHFLPARPYQVKQLATVSLGH